MRYSIFLFLILFTFCLSADVLLLKSADGSTVPGIALSWQEKDGGVLFNIDEKVDIILLKKTVSELFPNMRVEVMGQNLFFSSVKLDTLLPLVSGVDVKIKIEETPFGVDKKYGSINNESSNIRLTEKFITAKIISTDLDKKNMKIRFLLYIKKHCNNCSFPKLKGRKTAFVYFHGKDEKYPYEKNKKTADALLVKKGTFVYLSFLKKANNGSYEIDEIYIK